MNLRLQEIDYKLALIIVALLVIWQPLSLIGIFCLFIIQLMFYKSNLFHSKFLYLFLILTFYIIIKLLIVGQFIENIKYLNKLVILMVVFLSFFIFSEKRKSILLTVFVWMMFFIQTYSIIHIFYFFKLSSLNFEGLNNFSYINSAIGFERPYIGFLSAMSILFLLFSKNIIMKNLFRFFCIFLSLAYVFIISAKLASGISILLLITNIVINRKWGLLVGFMFIAGIVLFSFSKSLTIVDRFSKVLKDERFFLWNNSLQIIDNDPNFSILFGSFNSSYRKINVQLQEININNSNEDELKRYYKKKRKNIHNQYLEIYIFGGIIGVILLIAPFFYLIYTSFKLKNIVLLLLVISILSFMIFENVLERQLGVISVALLLALVIKKNVDKRVNQKS